MVIGIALYALPVGFTHLGSGIGQEALQPSDQLLFTGIRIGMGTMLLTIAGEARFGVFEPRAFAVVLRIALQRTTAEVAGIAIIRGCLLGTCIVQTTVIVESEKGFGVHSIVPYRQTTRRGQPSRYEQCGWM